MMPTMQPSQWIQQDNCVPDAIVDLLYDDQYPNVNTRIDKVRAWLEDQSEQET